MFFVRFFVGGLLVAMVPVVTKNLGPRLGGLLLVAPFIGLAALGFTAADLGTKSLSKLAGGALLALLPLALFYVSIIFLARDKPLWVVLGVSTLIWSLSAFMIFRR